MKSSLLFAFLVLALSFSLLSCGKKKSDKAFHLASSVEATPLNNPDEIECSLKVGHVFSLEGKNPKEKGQLEIYQACS
jgi:hypothetical protein